MCKPGQGKRRTLSLALGMETTPAPRPGRPQIEVADVVRWMRGCTLIVSLWDIMNKWRDLHPTLFSRQSEFHPEKIENV